MHGSILVLNAGSSSIKFSLFAARGDRLEAGAQGQVEGIGGDAHLLVHGEPPHHLHHAPDHEAALAAIHEWLEAHHAGEASVAAIGHRVVHGGQEFTGPARIDDAVLARLEALTPLAPLHQPPALAAIRAAAAAAPGTPQVACFDTAFHAGQPRLARLFALPRALSEAGVLRYGFHGLSYEFIASRLPEVAPALAQGRAIVAHLGNGASLCALRASRSVATTMGFTALDGLPMGTRCGALDPGVALHLLGERGMTLREVEELLYHRSGLLGVSGGIGSDMRTLLASPAPEAAEAVALFAYRVAREIGSLAAALGGLDGLVFTAGIGEHAGPVRAEVVRQCEWLGLRLDPAANAAGGPRISPPDAPASAWVIPTDENRMIARQVARLLSADADAPEPRLPA